MIAELYQSGHIALIIVAIMVLEAVIFARYFKKIPAVFAGLAAGICLVMALRASLLQQGWPTIGVFLALGAGLHVVELWQWLRMARNI
jgi:MFS superfamily sulfate permease-like transporter